jgi:hypothetical protein
MRRFLPVIAAVLGLLASCKGGGGAGTPSPTPGAPADREAIFLQLDVAVAGSPDPAALLGEKLVKAESLAGSVRWKPVEAAMPVLAKAARPVSADAYQDPGWLTVAFRGAAASAPSLLDAELGALLTSVASKADARGAVLHLVDDGDGTVSAVLGVSGHDAAEAAMALLDVWAPQLELSYAPEGLAEAGEVDRARLTEAFRKIPEIEGELKRAPGAVFVREGGAVRVTFPQTTDTRALAASLTARLGDLAAPRVVTDTAGGAVQPGSP